MQLVWEPTVPDDVINLLMLQVWINILPVGLQEDNLASHSYYYNLPSLNLHENNNDFNTNANF